MVFVMTNQIMQTAILMVAIVPPQPKLQLQELVVPQQVLLQIQQQLEDATRHGLVIIIVMISITTWTAAMMAETVATVVAVLLTRNTVQYAHALIQMEVAVEQLAHLLQQQLIIQVIQTGKGHFRPLCNRGLVSL